MGDAAARIISPQVRGTKRTTRSRPRPAARTARRPAPRRVYGPPRNAVADIARSIGRVAPDVGRQVQRRAAAPTPIPTRAQLDLIARRRGDARGGIMPRLPGFLRDQAVDTFALLDSLRHRDSGGAPSQAGLGVDLGLTGLTRIGEGTAWLSDPANSGETVSGAFRTLLDTLDRPNYAAAQLLRRDPTQALRELFGTGPRRKKVYLSQAVAEDIGRAPGKWGMVQDMLVDFAPGAVIPGFKGARTRAVERAGAAASIGRDLGYMGVRTNFPVGSSRIRPNTAGVIPDEILRRIRVADDVFGEQVGRAPRPATTAAGRAGQARQARRARAYRAGGSRRGPDLPAVPTVRAQRPAPTAPRRVGRVAPTVTFDDAGRGRPFIGPPQRPQLRTRQVAQVKTVRGVSRIESDLPYLPARVDQAAARAAQAGESAAATAARGITPEALVATGRKLGRAEGKIGKDRLPENQPATVARIAERADRAAGEAAGRESAALADLPAARARYQQLMSQHKRSEAWLPEPRGGRVPATREAAGRALDRRAAAADAEGAKLVEKVQPQLRELGRQRQEWAKGEAASLPATRGARMVGPNETGFNADGQVTGKVQHSPLRPRNDYEYKGPKGKRGRRERKTLADFVNEAVDELRRGDPKLLTPEEKRLLADIDRIDDLRRGAQRDRQAARHAAGKTDGGLEIEPHEAAALDEIIEGARSRMRVARDSRARRARNAAERGGVTGAPRVARNRPSTPRGRAAMRRYFPKEPSLRDQALRVRDEAVARVERARSQRERVVNRAAEDIQSVSLRPGEQKRLGANRAAMGEAARRAESRPEYVVRATRDAIQARRELRAVVKQVREGRVDWRRNLDSIRPPGPDAALAARARRAFEGNYSTVKRFLTTDGFEHAKAVDEARLMAPVGVYLKVPLSRREIPLVVHRPVLNAFRAGGAVENMRSGTGRLGQLTEFIRRTMVTDYGRNRVAGQLARHADGWFQHEMAGSIEDVLRKVRSSKLSREEQVHAMHYLEGELDLRALVRKGELTPARAAAVEDFARWAERYVAKLSAEAANAGISYRRIADAYAFHFAKGDDARQALLSMDKAPMPTIGREPAFAKGREGFRTVAEAKRNGIDLEDNLAESVVARAIAHHRAMTDKALADTFIELGDRLTPTVEQRAKVTGRWWVDPDTAKAPELPVSVVDTLERIAQRRNVVVSNRAWRRFNAGWKQAALLTTGYDIRNQIGDMVLLALSGRNPFSAVTDLRARRRPTFNEDARVAGRLSVSNRGQLAGDVGRAGEFESGPAGIRTVASAPRRAARGAQHARVFRENTNRRGAYMREARRVGPLEAARRTQQVLYDYGDVGRFVDWARRNGVAPFATWAVKNTPAMLRRAAGRPSTLYQLNQLGRNLQEESGDDMSWWEVPQWSRMRLPFMVPGVGSVDLSLPQTDLLRLDPTGPGGLAGMAARMTQDLGPLPAMLAVALGAGEENDLPPGANVAQRPALGTLLSLLGGRGADRPATSISPSGERVARPGVNNFLQQLAYNLAPPLGTYGDLVAPDVRVEGGRVTRGYESGQNRGLKAASTFGGVRIQRPGDKQQINRQIGALTSRLYDLRDVLKRKARAAQAAGVAFDETRTPEYRDMVRIGIILDALGVKADDGGNGWTTGGGGSSSTGGVTW